MQLAQPVFVLWDASHIWGLMAWRALRGMGLPCRLVKGKEIADGALLGKPGPHSPAQRPSLLLVPGGSARHKALALGAAGREAVRQWLAAGGAYLGFCGGAGLALSHARDDEGLNICPWSRASYPQRLLHLISGQVRATLTAGEELSLPLPVGSALSLPVWWPGRFAPGRDENVRMLAAYARPDTDFWLADLPLQGIPRHVFDAWQALYGVDLSADFITGQPVVISGHYGKGRYVLSYSHLETPQSPDGNAWLTLLLQRLAGLAPYSHLVPEWHVDALPPVQHEAALALLEALQGVRGLLHMAVEHHLFFRRTPWLWGWRSGLPGAACNNLHTALTTAAALSPSSYALRWWQDICPRFQELSRVFIAGAEGYLLACRLSDTLSPSLPDAVCKRGLDNQREALFGHPMQGGGLVGELLSLVEEFIYLSQDGH